MEPRDVDLEALTTLLGQCLGRIDEQAFRLQTGEDGDDTADVLENEAARLQELVGAMLAASAPPSSEMADLDKTLRRAVDDVLLRAGLPVVIRRRLATGLPPVACTPAQLAYAVERALLLAVAYAGHGGEVALTTRREDESVVFELEARGTGDAHVRERAATLQEFLANVDGRCQVDVDDHGAMLLAMELPPAAMPEDR